MTRREAGELVLGVILGWIAAIGVYSSAGCGGPELPCKAADAVQRCKALRIEPVGYWTNEEIYRLESGAQAWRRLCFEVLDHSAPRCEGEWAVRVVRDNGLVIKGLAGLADIHLDPDRIRISPLMRGKRLESTMAHEVGHALLGYGHLPEGVGLMSPTIGDGILTEEDRLMACERTGHCEWCAP